MKNHKWRLFFAVPIDAEKQEELQQNLVHSEVHLPGRALTPSQWHVTIFFVGYVEHSKVDPLIEKVRSKTWPEKFELELNYLGAFPDEKNAKAIWCGVEKGADKLREMATELSQLLHEMGLPSDTRFFNGHLTLSRLSEPKDVADVLRTPIRSLRLPVNRFVLFRSEPEAGPQHYEELASFKLLDFNV